MKTKLKAGSSAVTRVEIVVVVCVIAVLVVAIFLPALAKAKAKSSKIGCVNNLKQIGLSFKLWPADSSAAYQMQRSVTNGGTMEWVASGVAWPHFQVLSNELNTPKLLVCPEDKPRVKALDRIIAALLADGSYSIGFSSNSPISYFVGLDASEEQPDMLLAGDDNLEIGGKPVSSGLLSLRTNSAAGWTHERHGGTGNVCFADGSVRQVPNAQLRAVLANTGVATNRLAIP